MRPADLASLLSREPEQERWRSELLTREGVKLGLQERKPERQLAVELLCALAPEARAHARLELGS